MPCRAINEDKTADKYLSDTHTLHAQLWNLLGPETIVEDSPGFTPVIILVCEANVMVGNTPCAPFAKTPCSINFLQNNVRKVHKIFWKGRATFVRVGSWIFPSLASHKYLVAIPSLKPKWALGFLASVWLQGYTATGHVWVGGSYIEKRYTGPLALSTVCTWGRKKSAARQNTKGKDSCSHWAICVIFSLCFALVVWSKIQSGTNLCAASRLFFIGDWNLWFLFVLTLTNIIQKIH